ncbi:hypothetical protein DH2020_048151 [Rehmannia glutinosa]|uniref:DUF547 domain-containing protein n=1 Tax=Rehmannia glutinosa TaxID=99300 RepID=A0ABR0U6F3_REHGL
MNRRCTSIWSNSIIDRTVPPSVFRIFFLQRRPTLKQSTRNGVVEAVKNRHESSPLPPHPTKKPNEKVAFETKALHFISKAIKGDYHLSDFSMNEKTMNSKAFSSQKENTFHEDGGIFREKRDRILDVPTDTPTKVLSTPLHSEEENIHRWPPNKLSENIMKCLIFIFVRLLRTSRVMELEKSGPIARSTNLLLEFQGRNELKFKIEPHVSKGLATARSGYLQYGVPSVFSPENLLALINKATLNIAGNTINAQAIEHFILRKPEDALVKEILGKDDKDTKQMIVHELYGLDSPDPNIMFALCCGTRSSPAVKIYTADGVTAELERSKLEYLQAAIMVTSAKKIAIPELLLRNMNDFASDKDSLMEWVCHQLPTSGSLRKSIVDCFRGVHGGKASNVVEKIAYEFEFQYLLAI